MRSSPGTIASPNYPNHYPNDQKCTTLITAGDGQFVVLEIEAFNLERNDFVTINEIYSGDNSAGQQLGSYSGTIAPFTMKSSARNLVITFTTDSVGSSTGYQGNYRFENGN